MFWIFFIPNKRTLPLDYKFVMLQISVFIIINISNWSSVLEVWLNLQRDSTKKKKKDKERLNLQSQPLQEQNTIAIFS